jgi:hypothetical protein
MANRIDPRLASTYIPEYSLPTTQETPFVPVEWVIPTYTASDLALDFYPPSPRPWFNSKGLFPSAAHMADYNEYIKYCQSCFEMQLDRLIHVIQDRHLENVDMAGEPRNASLPIDASLDRELKIEAPESPVYEPTTPTAPPPDTPPSSIDIAFSYLNLDSSSAIPDPVVHTENIDAEMANQIDIEEKYDDEKKADTVMSELSRSTGLSFGPTPKKDAPILAGSLPIRWLPYNISRLQLEYLNTQFGGHTFKSQPGVPFHTHPLLAFERQEAENWLIEQFDPTKSIVDIGGNAFRHAQKVHRNVWSCCPILDPQDATRNFRYTGLDNWCTHMVQDCDCKTPDLYIAIHSIYYLDPTLVCTLVNACKDGVLYSVHHMFDKAYGSFAMGEAQYMMRDDKSVVMHSNGNLVDYRHSACQWLFQDYFECSYNGKSIAMAWTIIKSFPTTVVMRFCIAPIGMKKVDNGYVGFIPTIQNKNFYGEMPLSGAGFHVNTNPGVVVQFINQTIPNTRFYSWGHSVLALDVGDTITGIVPKSFVDILSAHIMLKPRDPVSFTGLVSQAKIRAREFNIPPNILPHSILVASTLAYCRTLVMEINTMTHMVDKYKYSFEIINHALKFDVPSVFKPMYILPICMLLVLCPQVYGGFTYYGLTVLMFLFALSYFFAPSNPELDLPSLFRDNFTIREIELVNFTMPLAGCVALPGLVRSSKILSTQQLIPLQTPYMKDGRPDKKFMPKLLDNSDHSVAVKQDTITLAGIIIPESIPHVHATHPDNELRALQNRALLVKQAPVPKWSEIFSVWLVESFDVFFPPETVYPIKPNFMAWNMRFPTPQRKKHDELFKAGRGLEEDKGALRIKAFNKAEKLLDSSDMLYIEKTDRNISGHEDLFNVHTGPPVWEFSKRLAKIWNSDNWAFYASGTSCEIVGKWFDVIGHNPAGWKTLEKDYGRFDVSVAIFLLAIELYVYYRFGMDPYAMSALIRAWHRKSGTRSGISASILSTVDSGGPGTSCGNTMRNVFVNTFNTLVYNPKIQMKELIKQYRIMALGDDSLEHIREELNVPGTVPISLLGLSAELIVHTNTYYATFCSSRFWPSIDGVVLGPKPGRLLPKIGIYLDMHDKNVMSSLLSTVLSLRVDTFHIPIFRIFFTHYLRVLKEISPSLKPTAMVKAEQRLFVAERRHEPSTDTFDMLSEVYDVHPTDLKLVDDVLSKVHTLPVILTGNMLLKYIKADRDVPGTEFMGSLLPFNSLLWLVFWCPFIEECFKDLNLFAFPIGLCLPLFELVYYIFRTCPIRHTTVSFKQTMDWLVYCSYRFFIYLLHLYVMIYPFFIRVLLHCVWNYYMYTIVARLHAV